MKLTRPLIGILSVLAGAHLANLAATGAEFTGLDVGLNNLYLVSKAQSRSVSPENFTGEKGKAAMATEGTGKNAARDLGKGWKVSPSVRIKAGTTFRLGEIKGPGCIQQIWMTPTGNWRSSILRFYWDDETEPSIECPVGDFFACGWGKYCQINSLPVCVNPGSAFNSYWSMPFRKKAKVTMENRDAKDMTLYYQVNYTLTDQSGSTQIRIDNNTNLISAPPPTSTFDCIGVVGQYITTSPYIGGYQFMPRSTADIVSTGPVFAGGGGTARPAAGPKPEKVMDALGALPRGGASDTKQTRSEGCSTR